MKEDFQNCDFGRYCTGLNIEVEFDVFLTFTDEIPCLEGSGEEEEGSGEEEEGSGALPTRKRRQALNAGGFDTSGNFDQIFKKYQLQ